MIEIEERTVVVVSLSGRLDGFGAQKLESAITAAAERGGVRVVLDCARVNYISSAGLRALLVSAKHCQEKGGKLVVASLLPECRMVFDMSGFGRAIDYHETSGAALAAMS